MTQPIIVKLPCGTLALIAKGDEKPWYREGAVYGRTQVLFLRRGRSEIHEIPRAAIEKITESFKDPAVAAVMKNWR